MNKDNECKSVEKVGIMIMTVLFSIVLVPTILFMIGIPISKWSLWSSLGVELLLILGVSIKLKADVKKNLIIFLGTPLLLLMLTVLLSSSIFDMSWDGNSYHKTCVGLLKCGWNPIYETFGDANARLGYLLGSREKWPIFYTHYPKATWIFGSVIYAVTGNIESGKCYTVLAMIAATCISLGFLQKYLEKVFLSCLLSILLVCNPISLAQWQSYYNDTFMYCLIIILVISLVNTLNHDANHMIDWCLIGMCVSLMVNSKFSGVIFAGIYCIGFFVADLLLNHLNFKKVIEIFRNYFCIGVISFGIMGAATYWHNTVSHHNPFYSITGEDGISDGVLHTNVTHWFGELPHPIQTIVSIFSRCQNTTDTEPVLKIPFSFNLQEVSQSASFVDTRVAGWGFFFSGLFVIALFYLIYEIYCNRGKRLYQIVGIVDFLTLIQIVAVPGLSAARYYLHLFFIPITALVIWFISRDGNKKLTYVIGIVAMLLMFVNFAGSLYADIWRFNQSKVAYNELEQMKDVTLQANKVYISLQEPGSFEGYMFNVLDKGINNYEIIDAPSDEATLILAESTCGLYYWFEK